MAAAESMLASPRRVRMIVALVLLTQGALLLYVSRASFVTADEPGYFAAGVTHWRYGAFDLYRVNPPLARMVAVLPVLLVEDVAVNYARWQPDLPSSRGERMVGQDFVVANGGHYLDLIRLARLSTIAWTLLGSWLVFAWARALMGTRSGLLALVVWCFDPTVLAHGALVTPDMPATVLGLAAMWSFARLLDRPSWPRTFGAGGLLGAALLAKSTNLHLLMVWLILAFVVWRRASRPRVSQLAAIAAIALLLVNLGYGFKGTLTPLASFEFTSNTLAGDQPRTPQPSPFVATGNRFRGSWIGSLPVPVPADYLEGLDVQRHDFEHQFQSYLNGVWRDHGWWHYYLYALAIKVPIGTLVLFVAGLALTIRRRASRSLAMLCVALPCAFVLVLVSSQTGFNSHLRYVLPMFPFLAIIAGRVAQQRTRAVTIIVALLVAWNIVSTLRAYPDTLAYFNETVGGPPNGDAHLLDSNIDWGQDALALSAWIARHAPDVPLGLAYFGGADPRILGLHFTLPPRDVPGLRFATAEQMRSIGPRPGLFAVSVNYTRGLSFDAPDGTGAWQAIDAQAFVYFRRFEPIATAGYSIRIYCIDLAHANAVRTELGLITLPPTLPTLDCATLGR